MTELEKQLLSALEQLQNDYGTRLREWENAFASMEQMYSTTRAENAQISNQVQRLSAQVQSLSEQLRRLAR